MSASPASPQDLQTQIQSLNPEQREAVEHFEGPILVLAGAGSGKTRVLTTRIFQLVHEHGVAPERILAVTFTNKAAGEMRERVRRMLGTEPAGLWIGTFHAIGARILRRHAPLLGGWTHAFTILDAEQALRNVKKAAEEAGLDTARWSPKAIRGQISGAKNQLIDPKAFSLQHADGFDLFLRHVAKVYERYQRSLFEQNAFDFDDLLVEPVTLFQQHPEVLQRYRDRFQFVLVDEYQDTNRAQFRFLELLSTQHQNLMVVGDEDQSIYGWRGADIRNILDFEKTFPGARIVRLEQNYRSTARILEAANEVIRLNTERKGKTLRTDKGAGEAITVLEAFDENDEARSVVEEVKARYEHGPALHNYRDFAVLYRTNAQSRALEDGFRRASIPYQIVGGVRFYERREIQDVLGYLRLVSNPRDEDAFDRVVNYPRRGVGDKTVERLREFATAAGIPLLEAAARAREASDIPAAGVRGLETFAALIRRTSAKALHMGVGPLLEELIEELDLLIELRNEGPEGDDRAENVKELVAGANAFVAELPPELAEEGVDTFTELDLFLQQVALVADVDRHDPDADTVLLMTLHNAKGLEFPVVFIAGLEDGLFPLMRAYDEPREMEEERRLFYVGMTRAEEKLLLTWVRQRRRAGETMPGRRSPFVDAVPPGLVETKRSAYLTTMAAQYSTPHRRDAGGFGSRVSIEFRPDEEAEPSFDQDAPRFVKGERVVHGQFGSGSVVEVSGFGPDLKVTINFDEGGRKKLIARYAGLKKDWDV